MTADVATGRPGPEPTRSQPFRRMVVPMTCQRCQNEATVHLTEPVKGQRREVHLCPAVPARRVCRLPESPPNLPLDAVVQSLIVANVGELVGELAELTCPDCGIKFMEFRAGGRLGCPQDYSVFSRRAAAAVAAVPRRDPARGQGGPPPRRGPATAAAPHPAPRGDRPGRLRGSRAAARLAPPQGYPAHDSGRPHEIVRRMAAGHRPRERHRHVLADPAGPEPRRLPVHQSRQPQREGRDRGQFHARRSATPSSS